MRLARLFELAIAAGNRADPRGAGKRSYADSAILYGNGSRRVEKLLVGIDIDTSELLLADRLRAAGKVDCVLSHHPAGEAYAGLFKVMEVQIDLLRKAGIDAKAAAGFLSERMAEVERKILPQNHTRAVDAARLLDLPFVCVHTPADNCAARYIETLLRRNKPATAGGVLARLATIPEYRVAAAHNAGPRLIMGHPRRPCGKIMVEMTGGAEGPKDAYAGLREAGVGTLVSMHIGEEHLRKVRQAGLNAVIAGHISSDTLGMNLILDAIEKEGSLTTLCCSGFTRIRRG